LINSRHFSIIVSKLFPLSAFQASFPPREKEKIFYSLSLGGRVREGVIF
jgi:hypothetical protein